MSKKDEIDKIVDAHNADVDKLKNKRRPKKMSKFNSKTIAIVEGLVIGIAVFIALGFFLGINYVNAQKQTVKEQAQAEAQVIIAQSQKLKQ